MARIRESQQLWPLRDHRADNSAISSPCGDGCRRPAPTERRLDDQRGTSASSPLWPLRDHRADNSFGGLPLRIRASSSRLITLLPPRGVGFDVVVNLLEFTIIANDPVVERPLP